MASTELGQTAPMVVPYWPGRERHGQAAHAPRSAAFGGGLVLTALAMLALTVVPGPQPMAWAVLLLVDLGRLRG